MNSDSPPPYRRPTPAALLSLPSGGAMPAVEFMPPDIGRYAHGGTGIPYVVGFEAARPGPHVMLVAVTHGNELCGAVALDRLLRDRVRPVRGRLSFCFANHMAYGRFDPGNPTLSRFVEEDLNRVWAPTALEGERTSTELRRARELRPLIDTVDFLLDIHSMQAPSPALMLAGPLEKGRALARGVGVPQQVVSDTGHAAGRRLRDYGGFADPTSPKNALLVECGQHWERASAEAALETAVRFLAHAGSIAPDTVRAYTTPADPPPQRFVEVTETITIRHDFRFARRFAGMEVVPHAGTVLGHDDGLPIRTPYDDCVLVMPAPRSYPGQTAVRLGRYLA